MSHVNSDYVDLEEFCERFPFYWANLHGHAKSEAYLEVKAKPEFSLSMEDSSFSAAIAPVGAQPAIEAIGPSDSGEDPSGDQESASFWKVVTFTLCAFFYNSTH